MSSLGVINVGIPNRCTTKDIHKKQEVLLCKFPIVLCMFQSILIE